MITAFGSALRQWSLYRRLGKVHEAGWAFTLRRWRVERQILRTRPIRTRSVGLPAPCEIRMLVYEADALMALWAAKSFYARSKVDWPLVWLQGGPISKRSASRLREHFPDSRFISLEEADSAVEPELARLGLTATAEVRRVAVYLRKPIDFRINGTADRALFLDTDVLFLERPAELLDAVQCERRVNLFNQDANSGYRLTPDEAERRFGVRPVELLNAGLCLVCRESIRLDQVERYLSEPEMRSKEFVDQLLYGLLGASFPTEHLPRTYLLSAVPGLLHGGQRVIARHYAGTTRKMLFTEGMTELGRRGFLRALARKQIEGTAP
jgi:hypothetical protein